MQQVRQHKYKVSHILRANDTWSGRIFFLPLHYAFKSNPAIDQLTKLQVTSTLTGKVGFINTLPELTDCCCYLIDRIL